MAAGLDVTTLRNSVHIDAPPEAVWAVLARLEALQQYDPAVARSAVESESAEGLGASRLCELAQGGWFRERVTVWEPHRELAFELHACTLPVRRLRHHYTLSAEGGGTRVEQRQEYELEYGPLGRLLDAVWVRRKWDAGVKTFFSGLKRHVEGG